jgi:hypothetical protein
MSIQSLTVNSTSQTAVNQIPLNAHISWEGFIGKYKPLKTGYPEQQNFTDYVFRESDDKVQSMLKSDPSRVWTYLQNDDGDIVLASGYHLVNREGYVITEVGCADDMTVEVHDDAWCAYSKLLFVCDPNVDLDALYEAIEERAENADELGGEGLSFSCDIRVISQEDIVKESHTCLMIELLVRFEHKEPTKEQLAELHEAMKVLCEEIRTETDGISVALHEERSVGLMFSKITDKSTKFVTCDVCGNTNHNHDWLDEGETCPNCKTVN